MSKLFVYGCSFSCNFQDLSHLPQIPLEEGWPFRVAEKLNMELVDRAKPGDGFNDISFNLQNDILDGRITKEDKIILSPSYFERLTFPELDQNKMDFPDTEGLGPWAGLGASYSKEYHVIKDICIRRFCFTLSVLSQLGYDIKGWCWTTTEHKRHSLPTNPYLLQVLNYIIPAPDGTLFWEEWILKNPECMLIPGKDLGDGGWSGDTHFSPKGHEVVAPHFFKHMS